MINPEFKAKWVAALRSGEYTQGKANLYTPETDSYCCLGVAGRLNGIDTHKLAYKSNPSTDSVYEDVCPGIEDDDRDELIQMNDGEWGSGRGQKTFNEIADHIEKYL